MKNFENSYLVNYVPYSQVHYNPNKLQIQRWTSPKIFQVPGKFPNMTNLVDLDLKALAGKGY